MLGDEKIRDAATDRLSGGRRELDDQRGAVCGTADQELGLFASGR